MPIYDLRCFHGHVTEAILKLDESLPPCPHCGEPTWRQPSTISLAGARSTVPPSARTVPVSWNGTGGGDSGRIAELRRTVETRRKFEEANPEHRTAAVKVAAHEGAWANVPLTTSGTVDLKSKTPKEPS